jgi:hypothetical protein
MLFKRMFPIAAVIAVATVGFTLRIVSAAPVPASHVASPGLFHRGQLTIFPSR